MRAALFRAYLRMFLRSWRR